MLHQIITTNGKLLGITDSVNYIKIAENGSFVPAQMEEAIGVAYQSKAYNLAGHGDISEAETVTVSDIDAGTLLYNMSQIIMDNSEILLNMQYENDMKTQGGNL